MYDGVNISPALLKLLIEFSPLQCRVPIEKNEFLTGLEDVLNKCGVKRLGSEYRFYGRRDPGMWYSVECSKETDTRPVHRYLDVTSYLVEADSRLISTCVDCRVVKEIDLIFDNGIFYTKPFTGEKYIRNEMKAFIASNKSYSYDDNVARKIMEYVLDSVMFPFVDWCLSVIYELGLIVCSKRGGYTTVTDKAMTNLIGEKYTSELATAFYLSQNSSNANVEQILSKLMCRGGAVETLYMKLYGEAKGFDSFEKACSIQIRRSV